MCGIAGTYQQIDGEQTARLMGECMLTVGPTTPGCIPSWTSGWRRIWPIAGCRSSI